MRREGTAEYREWNVRVCKLCARIPLTGKPSTNDARPVLLQVWRTADYSVGFLSLEFGHSCQVSERLWFNSNLSTLRSVRSSVKRGQGLSVRRELLFYRASVCLELGAALCNH